MRESISQKVKSLFLARFLASFFAFCLFVLWVPKYAKRALLSSGCRRHSGALPQVAQIALGVERHFFLPELLL